MKLQATCRIDRLKLAGVLAARGLPHYQLAVRLGLAPCTLSQMLRGHRATPAPLVERIERDLGLEAGSLVAGEG